MKGIAHFASAIAIASFFPQVVERSAQGSFVLLLAGLGGLAPDLLDFRLARFLPQPDLEISRDTDLGLAGGLDAQAVAERLAAAIERAHRTGRPIYVPLATIKLGPDLWQRYSVCIAGGQVLVRAGPCVDGAQMPVNATERQGRAAVAMPVWRAVSLRGEAAAVVDVFSGTALEFRPGPGGIEVVFLPWHRQWSHSLTLTLVLGVIVALLAGSLAGLVYALGSLTHILQDQLGHMGSNLLYPFTKRRINGLGWFHSGDALPNLFTVWLSILFLLMNLDRFSLAPVFDPWRLLLGGFVIPWILIGAVWELKEHRLYRRREDDGSSARQTGLGQVTLVDVSQDGERAYADYGTSAESDSGDG